MLKNYSIQVLRQISKGSLVLFLFRNELKGKAAELDTLTDRLVSEQKKSRELQWALEKEKTKMDRSEERRKEELEVTNLGLKYSGHEGSHNIEQ